MTHHHRNITERMLSRLDASLSDRDRAVLASLRRVRAATALQLERLHFTDVTRRQGRYEDRWFLELDRSTESANTLARKANVYQQYFQSGTEQTTNGVFPKVLWLVQNQRRHDLLTDVLGRLPAKAWPLHAVALADDVIGRIERGAGE